MLPEIVTRQIPGPESRRLAAELRRHESRNVTFVSPEWPVFWDRAEGTNVWDVDGNRFLDFTSAFAVAGLGHGHPDLRNALVRQAENLLHGMGDVHPAEVKVRLLRKLSEITYERWGTGEARSILCGSGFEAVEAALKTSVLFSGLPGVIAFSGGYHGLGYGALAVSGFPAFREPFRRQLPSFAKILPYPYCLRCPYGEKADFRLEGRRFPNCSSDCLRKLRKEIEETISTHSIGCVLVEPFQGRGGEVLPPLDFLRLLREICTEHKILLVADEIYTGFNRTGRLFGCDHAGVIPDLICLGKGLTSGFPLSACVGPREVMDAWPESRGEALHTSTFLGNPLGCAVGLASIAQHEKDETRQSVNAAGKTLRTALASLDAPSIEDVRAVGLMAGVELATPDGQPDPVLAGRIVRKALQDGIILLAGGTDAQVISLTPPFQVSDEEIEFLRDRLQEYLTSL